MVCNINDLLRIIQLLNKGNFYPDLKKAAIDGQPYSIRLTGHLYHT